MRAIFLAALAAMGWSTAVLSPPAAAGAERTWVLALTWEPAFCQFEDHRPPECADLSGFAAARPVLHGLWPEGGSYCGVDEETRGTDAARAWEALPPLALSPEVAARLDEAMPGRRSHLDRHEWIKHGTCSGLDAEAYYRLSLDLVARMAETEAAALIAANVGKTITYRQLCDALRADFGEAGVRGVRVNQRKENRRYYLTEMHIRLRGDGDGGLALDAEHLAVGLPLRCNDHVLYIDPPGP